MAKSAILKSSIAKKYWMSLTGLFLCLFLLGHLAGNLQLLVPNNSLNFNQYAHFMTTNIAVKALSYLTYFSLIFHAIDGILLTIQNQKARPIKYAYNRPETNSTWASRNMAILGTIILIFIVTHMITFWAPMHFDKNMPLQQTIVQTPDGGATELFYTTSGNYVQKNAIQIRNVYEFYQYDLKVGEGYKDLYKITFAFFQDAKYGLLYTLLYVLSMVVLAYHLLHGFGSAFQSIGVNNPKYRPFISGFGKCFAIVVPFMFAIIPLYIHFYDQIQALVK